MKAVNKNIIREITKTKNRFISIFTICAIGVGFFSGVRATGDIMKASADDYYDEHELFDLRVLSTFGLTDDDAEAIAQVEGVSAVYTSKYTDLAMFAGEDEYLTRVYSWNNDEVNRVDILEGRAPQSDDECIVSYNKLREGLEIGDRVTVADLTEADEFPLERTEYTVVGTYNTPMYISATQKGSTTIGDGSIDAFMYITESNFTQDVYTEIYIKSDELTEMASYSDEYEQLRDSISERLETLGEERSEIRYDEVIGEAEQEIADGEAELEQAKLDGQRELDDAKAQLDDAAEQIKQAQSELDDAKAELDEGAEQLLEAEQTLADAKAQIDSGREELESSGAQLDEAAAILSETKTQIEEGEQELEAAQAQLDESKAELEAAQAQLDEQYEILNESGEELNAAKQQLEQGRADYEQALALYQEGLEQYSQSEQQLLLAEEQLLQAEQLYGEDNEQIISQRQELEAQKLQLAQSKAVLDQTSAALQQSGAELDAAAAEIEANEQALSEGEAQLAQAQAELDEYERQYNEGVEEYNAAAEEFAQGKAEYEQATDDYMAGLVQYNEGLREIQSAQREYNEGVRTLEESRAEYESGLAEYNDGVAELEKARQEYADGVEEYEEGLRTYNEEIENAEKELSDAKKEIADAGSAKWYVFLRDDNVGYSEYESNSQRIDRIAAIFPVFFLLVAALVCLTTMSRMVEEQRTQIGTLKALGYSRGTIMRHYMTYAVSAAAIGSVIGAVIGCFIFPGVIVYAYSIMYNITKIHFLLSPSNILLSTAAMVAAIAATVFFCCIKALKETPASLMRPKAPKSGKRVLIEKIGFIWNRLSFFGKVSGRNLFRYKRRMFMTIVGIAGCTALMLTGFGLKNSISDIVNKQYNYIYNYSGYLAYDSDCTDEELSDIYSRLLATDPNAEYTRATIKQYTLSNGGTSVDCYVTVVEDADIFEEMVDLHERTSGERLSLSDGAIATEKLAKLLGAKAGDEVTIRISDGVTQTIAFSGITEHYASHYLYMTQSVYEETFGTAPEYNILYFSSDELDEETAQDSFSESMLKNEAILSVSMNSGAASSFSDNIRMMDLVVIVLIVSAGALAFVVLYNLTNINITERIREIATLKVLGFYDREVSNYVFRENIILSVIGAAAGLFLGTALCQFIIQTAEIDEVMFGRDIHLLSYVWSFLITVVFSLTVNFIMTGQLKKISMVESLKSVE